MTALLIAVLLAVCGGIVFLTPTQGPTALLMAAILSGVSIFLIARAKIEQQFLMRLFLAALLIRLVVGIVIFTFGWQNFFGGDAGTYDSYGYYMQQGWHGDKYYTTLASNFQASGAGAWGMIYMVGGVYELIGRNPLAIQFISAVIGAVTPIIIFLCAQHLFDNKRVARTAALLTAFFPSLVLWSSQGLKDGPIMFTLAFSILATLKLSERFSFKYALILAACLMSLLSLRFYIFYMMAAAVVGAFVIRMRHVSAQKVLGQSIAILGIGLALTWFGVVRYADRQFTQFANLEAIQRSRLDLAQSAQSGFNKDVDVSTTRGALTAIPIGMIYLLFAPFPWQLENLRQSIALPEMIIWWSAFPLLVLGLWFAIKYRWRQIFPILMFTIMLSLAYSVFQGNVGTAYRQRAQLLVFYFIFVAVGLVLVKEKQEERSRRNKEEAIEEWRQREAAKERKNRPQTALIERSGTPNPGMN
jgi:4-amino-4-deoxy-L-arabinose transferase-like glycosyltransferase